MIRRFLPSSRAGKDLPGLRYQFSIAILFFLLAPMAFSQSIKEAYNLNMRIPAENVRWSWLVYTNRTTFASDTSETVEGKHPLKILSRRRIGDSHDAGFKLMRTIPLPERVESQAGTVTMRCKNKDMENLKFAVRGIDENEDFLFSDSVFITDSLWRDYSISFPQKEIKAVRISLSAATRHLRDMQTAWVDKVSLFIGEKTIDDMPVENVYPQACSELSKDYVVPLSSRKDSNIPNIFDKSSSSKIVGLGECTHGCQEIKEAKYQFMKTLISRCGYRIILIEKTVDLTLTCDLYVRGLIPESFGEQIKEESRGYFDDYESFFDFLMWARQYNKTAQSKVRIFGFSSFLDKQTGLFEYFQHIVDSGNPNLLYYLQNIAKGKFQAVKDKMQEDDRLKSRMLPSDFNYLLFLLEIDNDLERKLRTASYNSDLEMWTLVKRVIDLYAPANEKILMDAHSVHLSKYTSFLSTDLTRPTLGNYLANKYKEKYFAVSFQVGEGDYTQDESSGFGKTMVQAMQNGPKSSFEYSGLQTGCDYFYYPAHQLPKDVTHLRMLLRTGRYLDQFYFCSIRRYFDGLVFVKEGRHLNNIESYPAFYVNGIRQYKQRYMRERLKKLGIKVEGLLW